MAKDIQLNIGIGNSRELRKTVVASLKNIPITVSNAQIKNLQDRIKARFASSPLLIPVRATAGSARQIRADINAKLRSKPISIPIKADTRRVQSTKKDIQRLLGTIPLKITGRETLRTLRSAIKKAGAVKLRVDPADVNRFRADIFLRFSKNPILVPVKFVPQGGSQVRSFVKAQNTLLQGLGATGKETAKVAGQTKNLANATKQASAATETFAQRVGFSTTRLAAYLIPAFAIFQLTKAFRTASTAITEINTDINRLTQIFNGNAAKASRVSKEILEISERFGQSGRELLNVTTLLAQSGKAFRSENELLDAARALAQTPLAATFGDITSTVTGTIAVLNQFNETGRETERVLDVANELSKKFAFEADNLFAAVSRGGGAFASAGGTIEEFAALIASTRQITRLSPEQIGTAVKAISIRGLRAETTAFLDELTGGRIRNAEGNLRSITDIILETGRALRGADPEKLAKVSQVLGGQRRGQVLIPLLKNISEAEEGASDFEKAINIANGAVGSLSIDAATGLNRIDIQLKSIGARFEQIFRDLAEDEGIQSLVKDAASLAKGFATVLDTVKGLAPLLIRLGAIRLGLALPGAFRQFTQGAQIFGAGRFGVASQNTKANTDATRAITNLGQAVKTNTVATKTNTISNRTNTTATNTNTKTGKIPLLRRPVGSLGGVARGVGAAAPSVLTIGASLLLERAAGKISSEIKPVLSDQNKLFENFEDIFKQNRQTIQTENRLRGASTGVLIGSVLGSALGPLGTLLGGAIGAGLGTAFAGPSGAELDAQEAAQLARVVGASKGLTEAAVPLDAALKRVTANFSSFGAAVDQLDASPFVKELTKFQQVTEQFFGGTGAKVARDDVGAVREFLKSEAGRPVLRLIERNFRSQISSLIAEPTAAVTEFRTTGASEAGAVRVAAQNELIAKLIEGLRQNTGVTEEAAGKEARTIIGQALSIFFETKVIDTDTIRRQSEATASLTIEFNKLKNSLLIFSEEFNRGTAVINLENFSNTLNLALNKRIAQIGLGQPGATFQIPQQLSKQLSTTLIQIVDTANLDVLSSTPNNVDDARRSATKVRKEIRGATRAILGEFIPNAQDLEILSDQLAFRNIVNTISQNTIQAFAGIDLTDAQGKLKAAVQKKLTQVIFNPDVINELVKTDAGRNEIERFQKSILKLAETGQIASSSVDSIRDSTLKRFNTEGKILSRLNARIIEANISLKESAQIFNNLRIVTQRQIETEKRIVDARLKQTRRSVLIGASESEVTSGLDDIIEKLSPKGGIKALDDAIDTSSSALANQTNELRKANREFLAIAGSTELAQTFQQRLLEARTPAQRRSAFAELGARQSRGAIKIAEDIQKIERSRIATTDRLNNLQRRSAVLLGVLNEKFNILTKSIDNTIEANRRLGGAEESQIRGGEFAQTLLFNVVGDLFRRGGALFGVNNTRDLSRQLGPQQLRDISSAVFTNFGGNAAFLQAIKRIDAVPGLSQRQFPGAEPGVTFKNVEDILKTLIGFGRPDVFTGRPASIEEFIRLTQQQRELFDQTSTIEQRQLDILVLINRNLELSLFGAEVTDLSRFSKAFANQITSAPSTTVTTVPAQARNQAVVDRTETDRDTVANVFSTLNDLLLTIKGQQLSPEGNQLTGQNITDLKDIITFTVNDLKEAREQAKSKESNIKVDAKSEVNINGFEDVGRFVGVKQIVISTLDAFRIRLSAGNAAEQQLANKLESAMRSIDPTASETENVK